MGSAMSCRTSSWASLAALIRASRCFSVKLVGTVMTAEVTFLPRYSEAAATRRRRYRVEASETVMTEGSSSSPALSLTVKATSPETSWGWAAAWQCVGSIDLNLN